MHSCGVPLKKIQLATKIIGHATPAKYWYSHTVGELWQNKTLYHNLKRVVTISKPCWRILRKLNPDYHKGDLYVCHRTKTVILFPEGRWHQYGKVAQRPAVPSHNNGRTSQVTSLVYSRPGTQTMHSARHNGKKTLSLESAWLAPQQRMSTSVGQVFNVVTALIASCTALQLS